MRGKQTLAAVWGNARAVLWVPAGDREPLDWVGANGHHPKGEVPRTVRPPKGEASRAAHCTREREHRSINSCFFFLLHSMGTGVVDSGRVVQTQATAGCWMLAPAAVTDRLRLHLPRPQPATGTQSMGRPVQSIGSFSMQFDTQTQTSIVCTGYSTMAPTSIHNPAAGRHAPACMMETIHIV